MAVDIGPKIGLEGEAQYRKQINEIITQAKTLNSEMKALESSFKNEGKSIAENTAKKKLLNEQIKVQEQRVEELNTMLDKSAQKFGEDATQTMKWQQAVNNATADLNKLKNELESMPSNLETIGKNMQDVGSKVTNVGSTVQGIGKGLTSAITVPVVGAFGASTKAVIDWESAFTGVTKTVDGSADDYKQLSENIKQMATETASSKEDIAGVMEVAGQLGVSGVQNLTDFTRTMVELGDTTNLSADEAATALARFMNITGEDTANVANLGSAIVDLGNNFATDEAAIVEMSTRLASAGSIAGLTSTDILALSTAMSSVGIQAEAGGTAMTQTLTGISTAVSEGGDKLEQLASIAGKSATDFANEWKSSPISALQEFIGGLSEMNASGEDSYKVLDELGMSGVRQSNMLQSLALASDQLTSAIDVSNQAYEQNTALQDEAAKRYETTESKISQAKEQLGNVAIEIGERLVPYIEKGLDVVDKLVSAWDNLSTSEQDNIIKMAAIAAAVGPIVTGIGSLIIGTGQLIMAGGQIAAFAAKVGPAISAIGPAISGMAASASAAIPGILSFIAPFAPYIAIAAAVVAAGVLIYKNWDTIKETAEKVGAAVAEKWEGIKSKTAETWSNVKAKTSETWNNVKSVVSTVGSGLVSNVTGSLGRIKASYQSAGGGIKGIVSATWTGIKEYFTLGFRNLDVLTNGKLTEIKNIFMDKFKGLKDSALQWGKDLIQGFIDGITAMYQKLKDAVGNAAQVVSDFFHHSHPSKGPMADDNTWMPDMMKMFASGIKRYSYLVTNAMDNVATDISVGMNAHEAADARRQETSSTVLGSLDAAAIYTAVKDGASDATISINIDGRELRRTLSGLGVSLA
jgi:TP901 family phage tail tape measure protein